MSHATYWYCECILFLFVFSVALWQPLVPLFVYTDILKSTDQRPNTSHNTSYSNYCQYCDKPETSFHCITSCNSPGARHAAQGTTSKFMVLIFVASEVTGVMTSIMWSRISDKKGRKFPMLASSMAHACFSLALFVFLVKPDYTTRRVVIASYSLIALTGGTQGNFLIGTKTLITETSKVRCRTHRLAVNECVRTFAQFLGFSLSGALLQLMGSQLLSFSCTFSFILLSVYCWLLPQVDTTTVTTVQLKLYKETWKTKRLNLVFWMIVMGRVCFTGPDNIFVMFLLNFPSAFPVSSTLIGIFLGYNILTFSLICFVYALMPSFSKATSDCSMIGIGLTLLMMAYACFCMSTSMISLFLGATFHGMYGFSAVSLNSILSKIVPENQLAQTFATVKATERILCCLMAPVISVTYQNTKHWFFPGTCFLIPLALCAVTGVILIVFLKQSFHISEQEISPLPIKIQSSVLSMEGH